MAITPTKCNMMFNFCNSCETQHPVRILCTALSSSMPRFRRAVGGAAKLQLNSLVLPHPRAACLHKSCPLSSNPLQIALLRGQLKGNEEALYPSLPPVLTSKNLHRCVLQPHALPWLPCISLDPDRVQVCIWGGRG